MAEASLAAVAPRVRPLSAEALAGLLEGRGGVAGGSGVLLVDSRPFADFNASHIADAVNVGASKLLKRRLLRGKVHVRDVLRHAAGKQVTPTPRSAPFVFSRDVAPSGFAQLAPEAGLRVVVYDENSRDASALRRDAFAAVLLRELQPDFPSVQLLAGESLRRTPTGWPTFILFTFLSRRMLAKGSSCFQTIHSDEHKASMRASVVSVKCRVRSFSFFLFFFCIVLRRLL